MNRTQIAALIASFSYILDIAAFAIVLPYISVDLGLYSEEALSLFWLYGIGLSVVLIAGGKLIDKFPIKRVFVVGVILYATSALFLLVSGSAMEMQVLRILQGVGAGLFAPCIPLLISKSEKATSAESLTLWGFWSGVFTAISPLILTGVMIQFGWRASWILIPLVAIAALPLAHSIDSSFRLVRDVTIAKGQLSVILMFIYVFISYGITTWFIYSFPFWSPSVLGLDTISVGVYSTILWMTFAVVCRGMRFLTNMRALYFYLYVSPLFLVCGALIFNFSPLSVVFAGIGMALANMPTTELILRNSKSNEYGFNVSIDIICARLGGVVAVLLLPKDAFPLTATVLFLSLVMIMIVYIVEARSQKDSI